MENMTRQAVTKNWEYYLALTLSMIGAIAVILMALRFLGVI